MAAPLPKLSGPVVPAQQGEADSLIIFVHGYGADGNDLIAIGAHWARDLPTTAFIAPNGPERCAGSPMGYQWFPISRLSPEDMWAGVQSAGPILDAFIDEQLAQRSLSEERLVLVGFSQGTMLSLHVALRRARPLAALIGYSGLLAGPEHLARDIQSRPPVFLAHGDADQVVPPQATPMAAASLGEAGVSVIWHLSAGIGHGIAPDAMDAGARFAGDALAGRLTGLVPGERLP
ncbi:MAG: dienelactone hydrolase family protein [Pseudomonadota bacterium]